MYRNRAAQRDPAERRFYGSAAWKELARAVVDAADACATCGTSKAITRLTGGHRLSIRTRPGLALDPGNVIAQCVSCQERAKAEPDPGKWPAWARTPRTDRW